MDLGDRVEDSVIDFKFHTTFTDGVPTALTGGAISIYKSNSTTQSTTGVTLTSPFDSVTGLSHVNIDTSADAFYAAATDYEAVITAGTVGGVSVVGAVVATFSIENRVTVSLVASDIRDALGMATNDLDTQLGAIKTDTAAILVDTGTTLDGKINTLGTTTTTIAADAVTIKGYTDDIGVAGAGLTAIPWNAAWDAEVQSECNDALVALDLDHLTKVATGIPALTSGTYVDQVLARTPSATSITNMNVVFATDFADNYNSVDNEWNTSSTFVLADGALTAAKFADGCLTNAKFGNAAIDARVLADGAIDATTLDSSALMAIASATVVDFIFPETTTTPPADVSVGEALVWMYKLAVCKKSNDGERIDFYNLSDEGATVDFYIELSQSGTTVSKSAIQNGP